MDKIFGDLDRDGVAVVEGVIDPAPLQAAMWDILADLSGGEITSDPATWSMYYKFYLLHSMLMQHYAVGHHQAVWDVRQADSISQIFAAIWSRGGSDGRESRVVSERDLLVSFDGVSIHLPPEQTGRGWYRGAAGLHTDQSYTRSGFECVQGFVTAFDTRKGDATFVYLRGSHAHHAAVGAKFGITDKTNWYKCSDGMLAEYATLGCEEISLVAPAGSLVLWDSRTIHCGREPVKGRAEPNFRFVVYVCMTERRRATAAGLRKKVKAFEELRMTSHVPHAPKLFSKLPRTYGGPVVAQTITVRPRVEKMWLVGY